MDENPYKAPQVVDLAPLIATPKRFSLPGTLLFMTTCVVFTIAMEVATVVTAARAGDLAETDSLTCIGCGALAVGLALCGARRAWKRYPANRL